MINNDPACPDLQEIRMAASRIRPYIHRTPLLTSGALNRLTGAELLFKCENFQKAGAFKARGAVNSVLSLQPEQIASGVATHSSGNHAQALAWAASLRNCRAFIVMPVNSSHVKIDAVKEYGGLITFCEPTLAARESTLREVLDRTGATEIHPYNDLRTITGQATAALEMIEDVGPFDILMTPVGGGGLLSGTALSAHYLTPGTKIIAAEPEQANDAYLSFARKEFVPSVSPDTIADGLRTSLGSLTFPIILKYVEEILTVPEEAIIQSMQILWERMKILVEPSAAVPFAAVLTYPQKFTGKKTGIIISGGNVDLYHLPWTTR
jgi:threonine dehydratase